VCDRDGDPGIGVEWEVRPVLLERPERNDYGPPGSAVNLNPIQVSEICHGVLNYRARPPRGEEIRMSIIPEQLEEPAVEPRSDGDTATQPSSDEELVVEDLLVEDVSIDGMCGVY
jgi:mycofactocin precursor